LESLNDKAGKRQSGSTVNNNQEVR